MKPDISRCFFGKFTKCVKDLSNYADALFGGKNEKFAELAAVSRMASLMVETSERFYMPSDSGILKGKELTSEIIGMVRLPYMTMSILSKQSMYDQRGQECDYTLRQNNHGY